MDNFNEELIRSILCQIGEDPDREGLKETPDRVVRSWKELYGGYKVNINKLFKTFEDGACDEIVILKDVEFYSTCEHHMLPFFGKIHVGYLPKQKVIGISKIARIIDAYSRRLQIQEKLCNQIADIIYKKLNCKGVMVVAEAQHFCMTSRGVRKQHSKMISSAIRGVFKETEPRNEFLNLIK